MADDINTAGETQLANAINNAQQALNDAFGEGAALSGNGPFRFLSLDSLITAYRNETKDTNVVVENFSDIALSIKRVRSSYLPIDFFRNETGTFESSIADQVSEQESYENAFMRMLGMPSSSNTRLASAADLIYINESGEPQYDQKFSVVEEAILDQRNKTRDKRDVIINNSIYNINNLTPEYISIIEEGSEALDLSLSGVISGDLSTGDEEAQKIEARITELGDDIFKFSYLLLPAIQDSRVSDCISETEKIVAAPFSLVGGRVVNSSKIHPTLLESVIRIRLDRLSGTDSFFEVPEETGGIEVGVDFGEDEAAPVNSNSYGMLESLFILRLRAAIGGLGKRLQDDIDDFIEVSEKVRLIPKNVGPQEVEGLNPIVERDDGANENVSSKNEPCAEDDDVCRSLKLLENQLVIEDAIMSLVGDNSEVLDLQIQSQRNSSIHDAHLMSSLLGIVDIPRKRIQREIAEKAETLEQQMDGPGSDPVKGINRDLGVAMGVGTIDVAVFCLALFTMSEEGLIGLLSSEDYENLLNNEYADLPASVVTKSDMVDSVNEFTSLVLAGYQEFQKAFDSDDQILDT